MANCDFSADVVQGAAPLTVLFKDLSEVENISSWDWDFGDGTSHGTEQNPTHVYQIAGSYTVSLKITTVPPVILNYFTFGLNGSSAPVLYESPDLVSWAAKTVPVGTTRVVYGNGVLVAVANSLATPGKTSIFVS
ncbi:MAG: PKD domain-containing protein, partial [Nitrospirae bacterium]|nr:PKD domain-containing protein [Nitrospirota bacterium]